MTRLRRAAGAVTTAARRAIARISDPLVAVAGIGLIAFGLSYVHPALPPIILGIACLAAVRSE